MINETIIHLTSGQNTAEVIYKKKVCKNTDQVWPFHEQNYRAELKVATLTKTWTEVKIQVKPQHNSMGERKKKVPKKCCQNITARLRIERTSVIICE